MVRLTVLHTNDLHGRWNNWPGMDHGTQIRSQVDAEGGFCFYFDCGYCDDTRLVESTLTRGASMDALLRLLVAMLLLWVMLFLCATDTGDRQPGKSFWPTHFVRKFISEKINRLRDCSLMSCSRWWS
jgi:hypothetical protein